MRTIGITNTFHWRLTLLNGYDNYLATLKNVTNKILNFLLVITRC